MTQVALQYERFPYPPVPWMALPKVGQGQTLQYEHLQKEFSKTHHNKRILVVGAGTIEPIVVAQMHPHAKEIVAIEQSQTSLKILSKRLSWARLCKYWRWNQKLPPIQLVHGDLQNIHAGQFDYIIATCVLHHLESPFVALKHLSAQLTPGGILRIVVYPNQSRFWIRQISLYLKAQGLDAYQPKLKKQVYRAIKTLPEHDFRRYYFMRCGERHHTARIVDAFFHACENPKSPMQWFGQAYQMGLYWQNATCDNNAILAKFTQKEQFLKQQHKIIQLQMADDLLLLKHNITLLFCNIKSTNTAHMEQEQNLYTLYERMHAQSLFKDPRTLSWQEEDMQRQQRLTATRDFCLRNLF